MAQAETTGGQPAAQAGTLSVAVTTTDGNRVVTPAGEIDHESGDSLRRALDASDGAHPRIVVDLHQVTFMDSTGINILINAHHTLSEAGGRLRLAAPTTAVRRTLQIVGVDAVIDCHTTLHDALTR
ncbi:STAS domain-containing protein [Streptomyces sp. NPDC050534]|uniref:STAS domain-containing protein n=1 Tax=Streptomyces sp. NPDC050534 TaxID=3365625 RepID=UPI0037B0F14F